MLARTDKLAVIQNEDTVRVENGSGTLGYDEDRALALHIADGGTEVGVGCVVESGGAIVKYQYVGTATKVRAIPSLCL